MLTVGRLAVENVTEGCVTDSAHPLFTFNLDSDCQDDRMESATLKVNSWVGNPGDDMSIRYGGPDLKPFTSYNLDLNVRDTLGQSAFAVAQFETGRMGTPWQAKWITDGTYRFHEKKVSPSPMVFRRVCSLKEGKVIRARLYATALGIYDFTINGKEVSDRYFAPGFTSYASKLQYQTYDVTNLLTGGGQKEITAVVAGGWAVGSFSFTRKNRISADRQALLAELRIEFEDGTSQIIGTDRDWSVTLNGPCRMADLYDGETYDARIDLSESQMGLDWHPAAIEKPKIHPLLVADYGSPVRPHEVLKPISVSRLSSNELVYDMGQNFAGVVRLTIDGKEGQIIKVRHSEILNPDGSLNTRFLRTAKATLTYICRQGRQIYSPRFTYMGFRYVSVSGISADRIQVEGLALYSDMPVTGDFSCSEPRLNRLQSNIVWGAKSNLMDIPTDCPQRDERMGWTGDIAVFAPTACYNFDMSRFLDKWLKDVADEQARTGGIPNTVPAQGFGFPDTMPTMAVDWWGDACVLVPWAEYQARGNIDLLERMYPVMQRYVRACRFWAGLWGIGKRRYIWHTPAVVHFGDWVAPDLPKMSQWQARSPWTATASLNNTSRTLAKVARELGKDREAQEYDLLADKVADAYISVFTDGRGHLKKEFQTAYVLPLYLHMFKGEERKEAAARLAELVKENGYRIGTGFPGTPYILFALADNGQVDAAYRMLLNDTCPSWLYEVKMGATTIWERWDGLDESGQCPIGDDGTDLMISYNHYASGAVGDFLYRRVLGIEMIDPGYRIFRFKPIIHSSLNWAKGHVQTPYGTISASWKVEDSLLDVRVHVPIGTRCRLELQGGQTQDLCPGDHQVNQTINLGTRQEEDKN